MQKQSLCGDWFVRAVGDVQEVPDSIRDREIAAAVPGCVHTALLAAGLIEDPYLGTVERDVQWIGRTDWEYRREFDAAGELLDRERIDLVCEGLDTIATVRLNGEEVGRADNMHCSWSFDIRPHLRPGRNELTVTFASPVRYAYAMRERLGDLPKSNCEVPFNFIRKMACNFGWDWGAELTTSGIWRPIGLRGWDAARIASVRPLVMRADEQFATVDVFVDVEPADPDRRGEPLTLRIQCADADGLVVATVERAVQPGGAVVQEALRIDRPRLWWPRGYGDQPLYGLTVSLLGADGRELDAWAGRVGLRRVELDTSPDEIGTAFALKVNGREVWCKGANWIPDDCFLDRACRPERYAAAIGRAIDANMNMLRVWGGGIFETDEFYDLCDELGVMVWQDFLFACAAYPEEEPLRSQVEAEARQNVSRLARHASLVIWNGCNENLWGYLDWGWSKDERLKRRTWGKGYYFGLLPAVVGELDPSRPYWPGSPYSGRWDETGELRPNDANHGNKHFWEAWFGDNYHVYRNFVPRFCSEFGWQGPACWATMREAIGDDQLRIDSEGMKHRQKSRGGDERNERHLAVTFERPGDFDDWHYVMQLNQARALTTGVEWFRSRQPVCMGSLYWQLNDCWPVTSWAAVDGAGRLKPLWYATRRFYAPRLITIQPEGDGLAVFAVNDTDEPWQGELTVARVSFEGRELAAETVELAAGPRCSHKALRVSAAVAAPTDASRELLVATAGEVRGLWFFDADKALAYPRPDFEASLEVVGRAQRLTVTARTLIRDLAIFPDRLDPAATIDDQLVTLLPGESVALEIRSGRPLTKEALTCPPVCQCANWFGSSAGRRPAR